VQGWNGSAWVTLASVTGNKFVKRTVSFPAFTTDRIRVHITNARDSLSRITEIEAWAPQPLLAQEVAIDTDLRNHPEILWYPRFDSLENAKADWTIMSPNYPTPYGVNPSVVDAPQFGMKAIRQESSYEGHVLCLADSHQFCATGDGSSVMNWRQYINENTRQVSGEGRAVGNVPQTDLYLRYCIMMESDVPLGMTELGVKLSGFAGPPGMGVGTIFWHARPDAQGRVRLTTYWFGKDLTDPTGFGGDHIQGKYLVPNQWHCLEQHLRLNTRNPDGTFNADAVLEAWFDDELVFRKENFVIHEYSGPLPIEINSIAGHIFHGGNLTPSFPIHWRYTGFALAKRRIGMPRLMH
jgi:hypothetical protein